MSAPVPVAARLKAAGLVLPSPMAAAANYVPHVATRVANGWLVHTAGQGPYRDGKLHHLGCIGSDIGLEQACDSAHMVALNVLTQAQAAGQAVIGDNPLDRARCLRLGIFLYCVDGFDGIGAVADAASNTVLAVLGDAGRHARSVAGMNALPMHTSVEIDGIFFFGEK
ncbi:MAG: RidA family protein [Rhodospirillales bacterium]